MKKKILNFSKLILASFLAVAVVSTSFVGCKNYDDDIAGIRAEVAKMAKDLADLSTLVKGLGIKSVVKDGDGLKFTMEDNSVVVLKGAGELPAYTLVEEGGNIVLKKDGVAVGTVPAGDKVEVKEDGILYINNEPTDIKINESRMVKDEVNKTVTITMPNAEGKMESVTLKYEGTSILNAISYLTQGLPNLDKGIAAINAISEARLGQLTEANAKAWNDMLYGTIRLSKDMVVSSPLILGYVQFSPSTFDAVGSEFEVVNTKGEVIPFSIEFKKANAVLTRATDGGGVFTVALTFTGGKDDLKKVSNPSGTERSMLALRHKSSTITSTYDMAISAKPVDVAAVPASAPALKAGDSYMSLTAAKGAGADAAYKYANKLFALSAVDADVATTTLENLQLAVGTTYTLVDRNIASIYSNQVNSYSATKVADVADAFVWTASRTDSLNAVGALEIKNVEGAYTITALKEISTPITLKYAVVGLNGKSGFATFTVKAGTVSPSLDVTFASVEKVLPFRLQRVSVSDTIAFELKELTDKFTNAQILAWESTAPSLTDAITSYVGSDVKTDVGTSVVYFDKLPTGSNAVNSVSRQAAKVVAVVVSYDGASPIKKDYLGKDLKVKVLYKDAAGLNEFASLTFPFKVAEPSKKLSYKTAFTDVFATVGLQGTGVLTYPLDSLIKDEAGYVFTTGYSLLADPTAAAAKASIVGGPLATVQYANGVGNYLDSVVYVKAQPVFALASYNPTAPTDSFKFVMNNVIASVKQTGAQIMINGTTHQDSAFVANANFVIASNENVNPPLNLFAPQIYNRIDEVRFSSDDTRLQFIAVDGNRKSTGGYDREKTQGYAICIEEGSGNVVTSGDEIEVKVTVKTFWGTTTDTFKVKAK